MEPNTFNNNIANFIQKMKKTKSNITGFDFTLDLENFEVPDFIVENLMYEKTFTLITGDPGVGKSTLVLQLAQAVAEGKPFLGYQTQQRPVYYFSSNAETNAVFLSILKENTPLDVSNVIIDLEAPSVLRGICCDSKTSTESRINFLKTTLSKTHDKEKKQKINKLITYYENILEHCKNCNPYFSLIEATYQQTGLYPVFIFDSLQSFLGYTHYELKSNDDIQKFMSSTFSEFTKRGATVIVIHHPAKDQNNRFSQSKGALRIVELADLHFHLQRLEDYHKFFTIKTKFGLPIELYLIRKENDLFTNVTHIKEQQPVVYLLKFIQNVCSNEPLKKTDLVKKFAKKFNFTYEETKKLLDDVIFEKKLITFYKDGSKTKRPIYYITGLNESGLDFLRQYDLSSEDVYNTQNEDELKTIEEIEEVEDDVISFVPTQTQNPQIKEKKQQQHKPRNPNCRRCAPEDCKYFEEEGRYWCYFFGVWCDEVKEGRK